MRGLLSAVVPSIYLVSSVLQRCFQRAVLSTAAIPLVSILLFEVVGAECLHACAVSYKALQGLRVDGKGLRISLANIFGTTRL